MIGLDTNVLVRFLTQDDPVQGAQAHAFVTTLTEAKPGFIGREVMVETVWVLERAYKLTRVQIASALEHLLEAQELVIEAHDGTAVALSRYREGGPGFADQMIALQATVAGCGHTVTFDRQAATLSEMQLLGAVENH